MMITNEPLELGMFYKETEHTYVCIVIEKFVVITKLQIRWQGECLRLRPTQI
jgi:hypothetical protein